MRAWWLGGAAVVGAIGLVLAGTCAHEEAATPDSASTAPRRPPAPPDRGRTRAAVVAGASREVGDGGSAAPAAAPATTIAIVRVANRDGTPAAGAEVDLHCVRNGPKGRETPVEVSAVAGADGVARLEVKPAEYFARARLGDDIGASGNSRVPQLPGAAETTLPITLRPAVVHRGRVIVEGTGLPIPGARVHVHDGGIVREATTDADGRFEVPGVAYSRDPLAWAEAFGYVAADRRHKVDSERSITWTLSMHPGVVLRGTLRGPDGPCKPAGETWIVIVRDGDESGGVRIDPDADGRFDVTFRGRGALFVRAPGFVVTRLPVESDGTGVLDAGIVELRPGLHLRGRVVDREGRPVPNVVLGAKSLELGLGVGVARTYGDGRFDLTGLGPGEHQVDTWEDVKGPLAGGRPATSRRGVFAGTELTIEQPEGNAVLVRLRDPADAELVVGAVRVWLRAPRERGWGATVFGQNVHTVRVLAPAPQRYDLRIEADGYEPVEKLGVVFPEGRASPLDVRLARMPK
jgi:hypothetical protein